MGEGLHFLASPSCLERTVMGQRSSAAGSVDPLQPGDLHTVPHLCPLTMGRGGLSLSSPAVCSQSPCRFRHERG